MRERDRRSSTRTRRVSNQPHGGGGGALTAPFGQDVYIDSTAPATDKTARLSLGFVEGIYLFEFWDLERLKTRVLETLVGLTAW